MKICSVTHCVLLSIHDFFGALLLMDVVILELYLTMFICNKFVSVQAQTICYLLLLCYQRDVSIIGIGNALVKEQAQLTSMDNKVFVFKELIHKSCELLSISYHD